MPAATLASLARDMFWLGKLAGKAGLDDVGWPVAGFEIVILLHFEI